MSKSTLWPMASLASAIPADMATATPADLVLLCDGFHELLLQEKVLPAGTAVGRIRDQAWERDINQLVSRAAPRLIYSQNSGGVWVAENVSVKLSTVQVEVDDLGEVCCWIYEES